MPTCAIAHTSIPFLSATGPKGRIRRVGASCERVGCYSPLAKRRYFPTARSEERCLDEATGGAGSYYRFLLSFGWG